LYNHSSIIINEKLRKGENKKSKQGIRYILLYLYVKDGLLGTVSGRSRIFYYREGDAKIEILFYVYCILRPFLGLKINVY